MKLRLVSDGTPFGTRVVDEETGEALQQVAAVKFEHQAGHLPELEVTLNVVKLDAVGMPTRYYMPNFGYIKAMIFENGDRLNLPPIKE